jgi:pyruvate/2-oxoglutarate dehydrogenase complex dihydrolipoamide dehydrogenase (E3) component
MKYDLAVIGGGSAGLSMAAAAAQFGENVVLFEKDEMGGDCLNSGCVPSKALLAAAKAAEAQRGSAKFGIAAVEPMVDYAQVMGHVESVIQQIAPLDSQERFEKLGVTVVRAPAVFTSPDELQAAGQKFQARRIIIATGSRAALPPIAGLKDVDYLTNETLFKNRVLPKHLIIIGGGPIGLEMAQAHRRLGSAVTVLEAFSPLAKDDPELAKVVLEALTREGISIMANAKIKEIRKVGSGLEVAMDNDTVISGTHLLVAAGRAANVEGLNLGAGNIAYSKHGITVDEGLRSTSNRKVYAAGDVAGGLQFTHVAGYHAGLIIRNALFRLPVKNRADIIPWVTYTDPELAHAGLSEVEAAQKFGTRVKVLRWSFQDNDRAQAEKSTEGLVKIILGPRGRIVGAGIVGAHAGELIAVFVLAISQGMKISAFANLVMPYPTLSEAAKRAAISNYAGLAQKPLVRRVIGFLKKLG